MTGQTVLVMPRVEAPRLDAPWLSDVAWQRQPSLALVRAEDGEPAIFATEVRLAWSARGLHLRYACIDTLPVARQQTSNTLTAGREGIGALLDPHGERSSYLMIFVTPDGHTTDARVENPLHRGEGSEIDETWECTGRYVRCCGERCRWVAELFLPFSGLTPVMASPNPGDRWAANFYRVECHPLAETSAWQPVFTTPPDLHASDYFGVIEFGN